METQTTRSGPQRLGAESRRERRIDPTGDAEDDVAKAVLLDVAPQPELECEPHLLELVERRGDPSVRRAAVRRRGRLELDHGRIWQHGMFAREGTAARVAEAVADSGGRVDVDDQQRLLERGPAGDDRAILVEDERMAVEHELVLTADSVHEGDPARVVPGADAQHLLALAPLAQMERRGRDVADHVRAGKREVGRRRPRLPDVLADGRPDERVAEPQQEETPAGLEVPVLVEDSVVRQEALAADPPHLAAPQHGAGVEEITIEVREPDERRDPRRLGRDRLEAAARGAQKSGLEQEILGRIAGHRELREEDEVGACATRLLEPRHDALAISVEVADHRVDLCQR